MVKKLKAMSSKQAAGNSNLTGTVKDSAQQIWLAGLGAFAKAQEEGGKVFDVLVKEGMSIQKKTQAVAEERVTEATSKMSAMAEKITGSAGQQWDKLEGIFEERVGKALNKLGVPSSKDIDMLTKRIEELNKSVQKLSGDKSPKAAVAVKAPVKAAVKAVKAAVKPIVKATSNGATKPAAKRAVARKAADVAPATV
jgi:poly(hydroxyalkanoate) granule-associated protein